MLRSLGPITQMSAEASCPFRIWWNSTALWGNCGLLLSCASLCHHLWAIPISVARTENSTSPKNLLWSKVLSVYSSLYFSVDFTDAQQGGVLLMEHLAIYTLLGFSLLFFLPVSSLVQKPPCSPESEVPHSSSSLRPQLQLQVVCQGIFFLNFILFYFYTAGSY